MIDTLIFDYGGVVSDHYCEPFQGRLAELLGVSRKQSRELISERSSQGKLYRLDEIDKAEFWFEVMKIAEANSLDIDLLQELWAKTYIINQAVLSLIRYLRDDIGVQIGIIMNEDRWRYKYILETYNLDKEVSFITPSFLVGALKPEKEIYEAALSQAQKANNPESVIYIDDRETHVEAATKIGMQGYVYVNAGELSHFIETINFKPFTNEN